MIQRGSLVRHRIEGWRGVVIHVFGGPQAAYGGRQLVAVQMDVPPPPALALARWFGFRDPRRKTFPLQDLELVEQDPSQR
ncbi:MAG: hypothetical protein J2P57_13165 [Acidimicrobiaceae bacterium]|nr:hypothetical protein [Acidimicrobiaceae bacterium]